MKDRESERRSVDHDAPTGPLRAGATRGDAPAGTPDGHDGERPAVRLFAGGLVVLLAVVGVVAVALLLLSRVVGLPDLNPFDSKSTDRSQPVLLKSVRDLSRYTAAEGSFQVVVDTQRDRDNIPDFLVNQRTLFVAAGNVDATVDFSSLGRGAVEVVDEDTVRVRLPAPELQRPSLDVDRSYIYSEQRGLVNRLGDLVGTGADDQQELYRLASQKIAAASRGAELTDRAQANTEKLLDGLFGSLGYDDVDVTFTGGADDR